MRKIQILLLLFIFSEAGYLFAGTPGMLIRCRRNTVQLFGTMCDTPGFVTYEGHCYPLPVDGTCPEFPPFLTLVPVEVMIDGEPVTICVPDCSMSCVEDCDPEDVYWDADLQGCACDDGMSPTFCGCPEPLEESTVVVGPLIIDGFGSCILPEQNCYDLGIEYTILPYICDGPQMTDTITITIKPAGGGNFTPFEDALTIEDLVNCDLIDDTDDLITAVGLFGEDDRFAFVADASGCIVIEFTRDPTQDTEINFLDANNEPIVIPACPRAFDPCSCRPENIVDQDDIVLFWYDELTLIGTPNTQISVQSNNIMEGFLDLTQTPYSGPLGMTDNDGLFNVPFYRTPGFDTDVVLVDANNETTNLMSECNLPTNFCAQIVPTLGEWSIIVLSLLLLIFGVVGFKYQSRMRIN